MLHGLFGNRNVARILLFLFVNEECYASQIQASLQVPLTPVQKALSRLEKESIIESHREGKVRIYNFNPYYPCLRELESLLKKGYTLLPPSEKKRYCFIHRPIVRFVEEIDRERFQKKTLLAFWESLCKVQRLSLEQREKTGRAHVKVAAPNPTVLTFQESGFWFQDGVPKTKFSNHFRWSLDLNTSLITLEHLRYGQQHPVFLFHLTPTQPNMLESVDAHLCGEDTYLGNIAWNRKQIDFHWRVIGPNKNDRLVYCYTQ